MIEHSEIRAGLRLTQPAPRRGALPFSPYRGRKASVATVTGRIAAATGLAVVLAAMSPGAHADEAAAANCTSTPGGQVTSPYQNYACLDAYLGDDIATRFLNYYKLEWGQGTAPSDPNAPASRREDWPATPETTPPMPFTEWPYGAATPVGVTRPSSADSPLMNAIANTDIGQWMTNNHFQFYGWVDAGFNVSSNTVRPGGNSPVSYSYTPNTVQLDQAVVYFERLPDTVQTDSIDWGMRLSAIYGENYRYTFSYSPFSTAEFLKNNSVNGYDFPMLYGEVWVPQVADGLLIRIGRYISVPDIEAQLAPNNYMYSHSLSYAFDNYTNEGIQSSLYITPQLMVQVGVNVGTESYIGHLNDKIKNLDPSPLYPGSTFSKDPGATPSLTACIRYTWNDGHDTFYPCMDAINGAEWGFNNLQWYGTTYYHKFNDQWHTSSEFYVMKEHGVPNLNNVNNVPGVPGGVPAIIAAGGTPFSPQYVPFNAPNAARCQSLTTLTCTATAIGAVTYINYTLDALNNFSLRPEYYADEQGQRTGTKANYYDLSLGWQHWLSPQIEFRPEIGYYRSIDAKAFNGDSNAGIAPDKNYTAIGMADVIVHF
jgi:Putative beta-barrel porin-2, OmpL-like. bbp2